MDKKQFKQLLCNLAVSKNSVADKMTQDVYYNSLGKLPYIKDILDTAILDKFNRGFPEVSDLFEKHKIIEQNNYHYTKKKEDITRKDTKISIPRDRFVFCQDAFHAYNLCTDKTWAAIEEGEITVPFNYSNRTIDNKKYLIKNYINSKLMVELKRSKSKSIFNNKRVIS